MKPSLVDFQFSVVRSDFEDGKYQIRDISQSIRNFVSGSFFSKANKLLLSFKNI